MERKELSEEDIVEIKRLREKENLAYYKIARRYHTSYKRIRTIIETGCDTILRNGIRRKLTKEDEDNIVDLYVKKGVGYSEIARVYHISGDRIRAILKGRGIKIRTDASKMYQYDNKEWVREVIRLYEEENVPIYDISRQQHVHIDRIRYIIRNFGKGLKHER